MNSPGFNTFIFTLLEATISLYPANADGSPNTGSPIWTGVPAENLIAKERWIKTETRPSGAPYPRKHPLIQQYEISMARVWALQLTNTAGLVMAAGKYVLDVVSVEEETGNWHRETFYNVTISDRSRSSRSIDEGYTDELVFDAEYMAPPSGGLGAIPVITSAIPYVVQWVGADAPGGVPLYIYDPVSHNFTEAVAGISAGRATLAYSPANQSGVFNLAFNGTTVLQVQADGGLALTECFQGAPDLTQLPRLDFYYGNLRLGSVTSAGRLYAAAFDDGAPTAATGQFQFYGASALAFALSSTAAVADYIFQ